MGAATGFFTEVDEVLLARARRGDIAALECLYEAFAEPVYTLARRLCRSTEEAEEVLQETFLEIVRSVDRFRGDGAIGAWIRRIAVSKALTGLRRKRRGDVELVEEVHWTPNEMPIVDEADGWRRVDLEKALSRLPDASRAVVWLHDVEGLTHAEIGKIFGRSTSFSKSQLSRAHARLRSWLGRAGGAEYASENGRAVGVARR
jgi:RNA polymerase sigma-70 factor (ECF subfamily)